MPFMRGPAPIRRTLKYLEAGRLVFQDKVKIFSINYNMFGDHHSGTRDFVFWYVPQIQFKNPDVQVVSFKNMTPSPFMKCFYESGHQMLIDTDSRPKEEILEHLIKVVGKSEEVLRAEAAQKSKIDNPANFGYLCEKHCICEIPGQVPCPATVPVPEHWRGKYKYSKME